MWGIPHSSDMSISIMPVSQAVKTKFKMTVMAHVRALAGRCICIQ